MESFFLFVQQPFLAFKLADGADILRDLNRSAVSTLRVMDGKIADVDELAVHLDPEFSSVPFPCVEIIKNFLHFIHACRRMAVLHLAPDHCRCAGENAVFAC